MHIRSRLGISILLGLSLLKPVVAQESTASGQRSAIVITASASSERVRFTAPSSVVQIRLEVYNSGGRKLFDNEVRGGNVLDWRLQDGQADRLPDDRYLCVITTKTLSGRLTQRIGAVILEGDSASLQTIEPSQMTAQQSSAVGPVEKDASLTVIKEGEQQIGTVVAHNGEEGQIIRGRGALSFRIGDFLRGNDTEQMVLSEGGHLGIGIAQPLARLEVDGLIRTTQGIVFPDGTIQTSAANAIGSDQITSPTLDGGDLLKPGQQPSVRGKKGKSSKFSPDLTVNEDLTVNGNIIFTPPPLSTPQRDITIQNNTGGLRFFPAPTLTTSPAAAAIQFWGNASLFPGQLYLDSGAHDAAAVIMRTTGSGGTITERMRVTSAGNIGIGTSNPFGKLQVTTANDTTPVFVTAWDARHFVVGGVGNSGGIGMSYDQANQVGYIEALKPNVAWGDLILQSGGGNVGIGTTGPFAKMHAVAGGSLIGVLGESSFNAGVHGFSTNGDGVSGFSTNGRGVSGASSISNGVSGTTTGTSFNVAGVYGEATGSSGTVVGVYGKATNDPSGTGMSGFGNAVGGYFQAGGKGVHGVSTDGAGFGGVFSNTAEGMAIKAEGNVLQNRSAGGWVKAMALIDPHQPAGSNIVRCYNSQATGSAVSTPPCGFSVTVFGGAHIGESTIDFGFRVDDRFVSVTPFADGGTIGVNLFSCCGNSVIELFTFYPTDIDVGHFAQGTLARYFITVY